MWEYNSHKHTIWLCVRLIVEVDLWVILQIKVGHIGDDLKDSIFFYYGLSTHWILERKFNIQFRKNYLRHKIQSKVIDSKRLFLKLNLFLENKKFTHKGV